jgi:hypothetical protein
VPSPRVLAPLPVLGHASGKSLRGRLSERPGDLDTLVEQRVFAKFAAARVDAQVKDTSISMLSGPPPWRPPE